MSNPPVELISGADAIAAYRDHREHLEKVIYIEDGCIVFEVDDSWPYEIELRRCRDARAILAWVEHLAGKGWMTTEYLERFVEVASHAANVGLDLPG
jgi:hypothetical protein